MYNILIKDKQLSDAIVLILIIECNFPIASMSNRRGKGHDISEYYYW